MSANKILKFSHIYNLTQIWQNIFISNITYIYIYILGAHAFGSCFKNKNLETTFDENKN